MRPLLALTAACAALMCAAAAPAGAASPAPADKSFNCRASVFFTTLGGLRVEPLVANGDPNGDDRALCATDDAGPAPISLDGLTSTTASATTRISTAAPAFQMPASTATIENLSIGLPLLPPLVTAQAVLSNASASCVNKAPNLTGGSQVLGATILGAPVPADGVLTFVGDGVNLLLGSVLTVKFNQQVRTATSLRQRAVEVELKLGSNVLLSAVAGETKVAASGDVCSATGGPTDPPPNPVPPKPCPDGSTYEPESNLCVILRIVGGHTERIVVGKPFEGPGRGRVVALHDLPKSLRNTPCAKGKGPEFAILGTNGPDRITGTNRDDRILTLGGKDRASGGRRNDCIDGASGGGTFTGDQGRDVVIGGKDRESIKGGPDKDRLIGLGGDDRITTDFGADVVDAGSGNDRVSAAVNGPPATVNCGSGKKDVVTLNRIEVRRARNCERIRVTGNVPKR